jgi:light-regulated signal transduction histidine kinase (bacteriophytochrome)
MACDLSRQVFDVTRSLRETDSGRNVDVVIAEGLRAVVDPNLMRIAISNLISNAWKFTSKIDNARIEFGAVEKEEKTIYFVKDNGDGFRSCLF